MSEKNVSTRLLNFFKSAKKPLIVLASLFVTTFVTIGLASGIQRDFGGLTVTAGRMEALDPDGKEYKMGYKLYVPKTASETDKVPAALFIHGYQNDYETSAGFALEFARHGYATLAIDAFGHGKTNTGLITRGFVNQRVSYSYGWDSEEDGTYSFISGPDRYKIMMNFSNLDFFIDKYSKSIDPESGEPIAGAPELRDSSMGGAFAYNWLASRAYVDETKMIVSGHSMGTWAAWSVGAAMFDAELNGVNIRPQATILQAGEIFKTERDAENRLAYNVGTEANPELIYWNNPLLLSAKYDEFNMFRDYMDPPNGDEVINGDQSKNFLGVSNPEWNKVYGDFANGSAVSRKLYKTNHRLVTHDKHAIADSLEWSSNATGVALTRDKYKQTFMLKEVLVLLAMLSAVASAVTLIMVLKHVNWFGVVYANEGIRPENEKTGWKWWKAALITMAISAVTYPFMTQLGHGLFPFPEKVFSMTIGNGFLMWYITLILVMLGFTLIPRIRQKKKDLPRQDYVDMGLARDEEGYKDKFDWALLGKSALVVLIGALYMYVQLLLVEVIFKLDFRFVWPFFKTFTFARFLQFLVYVPFFALFFILNNSKIFAGNKAVGTTEQGFKAFMSVWWKYALMMVGGILFIILLEYIPFFAGFGPGADLIFGTTFGGPFMSLLIVFAPQVIVFSVICTYLYRKTGNVFVGALLVAVFAAWIITGGSAIMYAF